MKPSYLVVVVLLFFALSASSCVEDPYGHCMIGESCEALEDDFSGVENSEDCLEYEDSEIRQRCQNFIQRYIPPALEEPAVRVEVAYEHACALRESGELACWGFAQHIGQPDALFSDIGLGQDFTCGLTMEGEIQCWGGGEYIARSSIEFPAEMTIHPEITAISVNERGEESVCALTSVGSVHCWSPAFFFNRDREQVEFDGMRHDLVVDPGGAVEMHLTGSFFQRYIVIRDQKGRLSMAELCDVGCSRSISDASELEFEVLHEGPFTQVSAFDGNSCAIHKDETVHCFAYEFGSPKETNHGQRSVMGKLFSKTYSQIAIRESSGCGILEDDTLHCWGRSSPRGRTFRQISAGRTAYCGITEPDGRVHCWGSAINRAQILDVPDGW